ncbi:MAG: tail fiber domain-containing protein [Planctomycetota bacterium]
MSGVDGLLATGTFGSGVFPVSGAGELMLWYPRKAAFRAGSAGQVAWNDLDFGDYSVAFGIETFASGEGSIAAGRGSFALGDNSTAMGLLAFALGYTSTAMGNNTAAVGMGSTAMGEFSSAGGNYSTAIGSHTMANGEGSTAMGEYTSTTGSGSTALGSNTSADGSFSTALGFATVASGNSSTALGSGTTASANFSTAMGSDTIASGLFSTAMGSSTTASGQFSTSHGEGTKAESYSCTALGRFNVGGGNANTIIASDPIFEIGIGTGNGTRNNAMTVLKNGNVGIATTTPGFTLEVNGTAHRADNSPSWTVTSDARLKKNIHTLEHSLETLLSLHGVSFEYKDPKSVGVRRGFIAQEVEKVIPEWVEDGPDGFKRLTVTGFEALAVEAMRTLHQQNEKLAGEMKNLKTTNESIKTENAELRARLERIEAAVMQANRSR